LTGARAARPYRRGLRNPVSGCAVVPRRSPYLHHPRKLGWARIGRSTRASARLHPAPLPVRGGTDRRLGGTYSAEEAPVPSAGFTAQSSRWRPYPPARPGAGPTQPASAKLFERGIHLIGVSDARTISHPAQIPGVDDVRNRILADQPPRNRSGVTLRSRQCSFAENAARHRCRVLFKKIRRGLSWPAIRWLCW
jgi:hypothetical protein